MMMRVTNGMSNGAPRQAPAVADRSQARTPARGRRQLRRSRRRESRAVLTRWVGRGGDARRSLPESLRLSPIRRWDRRCSDNSWSTRSRRGRSLRRSSSIASLGFTSHPRRRHAAAIPISSLFDGDDRDRPARPRPAGRRSSRSFARELRDYVRALRRLGVELEHEHLARRRVQSVSASRDPDGQAVALSRRARSRPANGTRTTSRRAASSSSTACPRTSSSESRAFWQPLGFAAVAGGESPHAWQRLAGHGLVLGLARGALPAGLVLSLRPARRAARVSARERA